MSSVAGAVVTIDGDSSGLVSALQKGEKGLADVKQGARKLSDQLREVADDADKAAGAMIQNIGGPGAIKAIAGVGIAMGVAKAGVEAFMDSSENLFKSYGDEGVAAWDKAEKGLFAIKGAFAEALLGGRDLAENTERLNMLFSFTKVAVDLALLPLKLLSDAMFALVGNTKDQTIYQRDLLDIEQKYSIAVGQTTTALQQSNIAYEAMTINLGNLLRSKQQDAAISLQAAVDQIDMFRAVNRESKEFRANAEADHQAAIVRADALQKGFASKLDEAEHELTVVNDGVRQSQEEINERAREMLSADVTFQRSLYRQQEIARTQAYETAAKQTEAEKTREEELLTQRENLLQRYEELRTFGEGRSAPAAPPPPPPKPVDDTVYAVQQAEGGYAKLTKIQYDALDKMQQQTGDYSQRIMEMTQVEFDGQAALGDKMYLAEIDMQTKRAEAADKFRAEQAAKLKAEQDINEHEKAEYDAKELKRVQDLEKAKADEQRAAMALVFNLAVIQSGKMLAQAIVGNKKMSEVARAAMGNVASGLGDIAMVKSAEYAADGLWPQASGMAIAGTLGYTIAAALGADKKANAGPPTERQQPVQNYAYNLRIDSAFADSESISRRFAQMQEGARQRGLITAAA